MFIQLLASGTSQQNYSVCKFNLWAVTSNRRPLCRRDGGVCQRAAPYGLIGMLSKRGGMMGELRSKCPCLISICYHWFMTILFYRRKDHLRGNLSFCELCLFSASVRFILFRYFLPSVSVSLKSYGLCFSSRESCGKCQIYWADWTAGHAQDRAGASEHCYLSHRCWFMFQSRRKVWGMRARASVSCFVSLCVHDKLCESQYFREQHRLAH